VDEAVSLEEAREDAVVAEVSSVQFRISLHDQMAVQVNALFSFDYAAACMDSVELKMSVQKYV